MKKKYLLGSLFFFNLKLKKINSKKTMSPVVATALLLVISVISVVGFQNWFQTFSSSTYTEIQQQSSTDSLNTMIETVIESNIYFKNGYNNLTIKNIEIDGVSCIITPNSYSKGIKEINIGNCTQNATSSTPEIVVFTNKGIFNKKIYLKSLTTLPDVTQGSLSLNCSTIPYGDWILVPGNPTLGTSDFCVMKYEAKATTASEVNLFDSVNMYCGDGTEGGGNNCLTDGSVNVTSKDSSKPLTQIYQTEARQLCENLGSDYSLITNSQWVTIARNIENVTFNWVDGTIGSTVASGGGLKRGNVGFTESGAYNAASDPADRSLDINSLAMFTLSNGEEIWDLSGNVWEWTNDTFNSNAESSLGQLGSNWVDWTSISGHDYFKPFNSSLNADHGIGRVYTDVNGANPSGSIHAFLQGGDSGNGVLAGAFSLYLGNSPLHSANLFGFRCTYAH